MFKSKKAKKVDFSQSQEAPRDLETITKEYSQLCYEAGALQYQIKVLTGELDTVNQKLGKVNNEAFKRKELDKANEPKKEEEGAA